MRHIGLFILVVSVGAVILGTTQPSTAAEPSTRPVDFDRDIKPILQAHCLDCHSGTEAESDLRLDLAHAVIEGGNSGPAVVPGEADKSLLFRRVNTKEADERMPPADHGDSLSAQEIAVLRTWIEQGAKVPDARRSVTERRRSDHWSFQPIRRPVPPSDVGESFIIHNPIDAFLGQELQRNGMKPSPEADRATLLRRLSLDLRGLPPTPDEIDAFVKDDRSDAYDRWVQLFLESPQYGERWARHWLDQARYADSDGYTLDHPRSIWPWRDWVISALNRDMPFDQFVIDQLAGDLHDKPTNDQLIATGFHRNTQHNREGGSDPEQYRVERIADRVSTTGEVLLGLTLGCARCHDHKYDPISQREFFQIYAFFDSSDEPEFRILSAPQQKQRRRLKAQIKTLEVQFKNSPDALLEKKLNQLRQQEKRLRDSAPSTLVIQEMPQRRTTRIHIRGNFLEQGREVEPGTPSVLPDLAFSGKRPTRLDFARWIVSPNNPLTPRVTVNRIWQAYFGHGLVETDNDFGTQGSRPTHPELLDWLASEFVWSGWSLKHIHRLIVTSAAYRRSSNVRPDLAEIDPQNRLLARQSRLRMDAEVIRDSALSASGLLSLKIGGPGIFPPQPDGVMELTQVAKRKWVVSKGDDRYRRGIYIHFWRNAPYPFLKTFDAPDSNATCTRRSRTNTPLQSLTLLNDEVFVEAAQALAASVLSDESLTDDEAKVRRAFRLCLSREPRVNELNRLCKLLEMERTGLPDDVTMPKTPACERFPPQVPEKQRVAWTSVARALLNVDEFITRE